MSKTVSVQVQRTGGPCSVFCLTQSKESKCQALRPEHHHPCESRMEMASSATGLQVNSHSEAHLLFICLSPHVPEDLLLPPINQAMLERAAKDGSQVPWLWLSNWLRGEPIGILPQDIFQY